MFHIKNKEEEEVLSVRPKVKRLLGPLADSLKCECLVMVANLTRHLGMEYRRQGTAAQGTGRRPFTVNLPFGNLHSVDPMKVVAELVWLFAVVWYVFSELLSGLDGTCCSTCVLMIFFISWEVYD